MPRNNCAILTKILMLSLCVGLTMARQRFLRQPSNTTATAGQSSVLLRCAIKDLEVPMRQVQWLRDGFGLGPVTAVHLVPRLSIEGDSAHAEFNLRIENVQVSDEAAYGCQVMPNSRGENRLKSRVAYLTVLVPPRNVVFKPRDIDGTINIRSGDVKTITCIAEASKPASLVKIVINGRETDGEIWINEDTTNPKLSTTTTRVSIRATIENDNDVVKCVVTHPALHSPVVSLSTINVLYPPSPPVFKDLKTTELFENDLFVGKCSSFGGNPKPQIAWFIGGEALSNGIRTDNGNETLSVLRHKLRRQDNGKKLTCKVTSEAIDEPLQVEKTLTVYYLPTITNVTQQPNGVAENQPLEFKCQSSISNPVAKLKWYKENTYLNPVVTSYQITSSVQSNIVISSLRILSVRKLDRDTVFKCKVEMEHFDQDIFLPIKPVVFFPPTQLSISVTHTTSFFSQQSSFLSDQVKTVTAGGKIYMKCSAESGFPQPEIGWFINENAVSNSDIVSMSQAVEDNILVSRMELTLSSIHNGANIYCGSTNKEYATQTRSKMINLIVAFQPQDVALKQWPNDPKEGESFSITCESGSNFPPANITWYKNGEIINSDDSFTIDTVPGRDRGFISKSVLSILPEYSDNKAVIECRASNGITNQGTTNSTTLDIKFKPHVVGEFKKFQSRLNEKLQINVPHLANPEVTTYEWKKLVPINTECLQALPTTFEDSAFIEGDEFEFSDLPDLIQNLKSCRMDNDKKSLDISAVTRQHRGLYEFTISNAIGRTVYYFTIDVLYPPSIFAMTGPHTPVLELDKARLQCEIVFHPKTNVTLSWFHKREKFYEKIRDVNLKKGDSTFVSYEILNVTSHDRGDYRCVVSERNSPQTDARNYKLRVLYAPLIIRELSPNKVVLKRTPNPSVVCTAIGSPEVQYTWFHNSKQITRKDNRFSIKTTSGDDDVYKSTLTIAGDTNVDSDEFEHSKFTCVAENSQGSMRYVIRAVNEGPPDPPSNLAVYNVTNDTFVLTWQRQFDGGDTQSFQVKYIPLAVDGSANIKNMKSILVRPNTEQVTVTKLEPGTTYSMFVTAINQFGSTRSKSIRTTLLENENQQSGLIYNLSAVSSGYILILSCISGVFFISLLFIVICIVRRNRKSKLKNGSNLLSNHDCNSSSRTSEFNASLSTRGSTRNSLACSDQCDGLKDTPSHLRQSKRSIKSLPASRSHTSNLERRSSLDNGWDRLSPCFSANSERTAADRPPSPHSQHSVRYCVRDNSLYSSLPPNDDYEMRPLSANGMTRDYHQVEPIAELSSQYLNRQYHTLLPHERPFSKLSSRGRCSYVAPPSIPEEYRNLTQEMDPYSVNVKHIRSASSYDTRQLTSNPLFVRDLTTFSKNAPKPTTSTMSNDYKRDSFSFNTRTNDNNYNYMHQPVEKETIPLPCEKLELPPSQFQDSCQELNNPQYTREEDKDSGCGESSGHDGTIHQECAEESCEFNENEGLLGRYQLHRDGNQVALFV